MYINVCDLVLVIVLIVTVVIVRVVIVTAVIVTVVIVTVVIVTVATVVIVTYFSKKQLDTTTTDEMFSGQRFVILAIFG